VGEEMLVQGARSGIVTEKRIVGKDERKGRKGGTRGEKVPK
jgi:hypothetical protein